MRIMSLTNRIILFNIFIVIHQITTIESSTSTSFGKCSPKSCKNVDENLIAGNSGRPVCGSDGFTYPSRCLLELIRCSNKVRNTTILTFARRGTCHQRIKCQDYNKINPHLASFKPKCREDGGYTASQCNPQIGYCWCVTPQGLPLPYTTIKYNATDQGWPKCGKHRKSTTRRSSKPRKSSKPCRRTDKAQFNTHLIKNIHTEWSREHHPLGVNPGTDLDRIVLEWKFNKMDEDKNGNLDKNEYRTLRRIVKKAVKPLKCAKQFPKVCDVDKNEYISRAEWVDCLSRDGMDDGRLDEQNEDDDEDDDEGDDLFTTPSQPPHGVLDTRLSNSGPNFEDESSEKKDEDSTDCLSDRQTALSEQRADKRYELYIPECTPDGRYKKVQCYKSAGYCWCVHEDTGKNIPGTSVKNDTPKCDQITVVSRPMKGCPDDKKISFLSDLMDFFHRKMAKETNGTNMAGTSGPAWKVSREEQVATWSFVVYDKNKNKMLDKNEWKAFKDTVTTVKALRKCGKKLPRYCDINKDRQISMTEWLDCLNTNRNVPEIATATTLSPGSIRTGKNPLSVLMED